MMGEMVKNKEEEEEEDRRRGPRGNVPFAMKRKETKRGSSLR